MVSTRSNESTSQHILGGILLPSWPVSLAPKLRVLRILCPLLHPLMPESFSPLSRRERTRIPLSMSFKSRNRVPLLIMLLIVHRSSSYRYKFFGPDRRCIPVLAAILDLLCFLPLILLLLPLPLQAPPLTIFGRESNTEFWITRLSRKVVTSTPGSVIFRRRITVTMSTTSSTFPTCRLLPRKLPFGRTKEVCILQCA